MRRPQERILAQNAIDCSLVGGTDVSKEPVTPIFREESSEMFVTACKTTQCHIQRRENMESHRNKKVYACI
jgi:hypothetical protein